ncbi:MAG TPA: hypothetical protein VFN57_06795, partial [Thermomicrobiaceae bacterium]|nr:hypothetical protein [Thermomicrobiaceae bacterium]
MRPVSRGRERGHAIGARRRFHWWLSGIGAAILVLSLGLNAAMPARAAASEFVQPGSVPATDGATVVWVDHGVYAARFPNPQPTLVASAPNMTYLFPDVSGDIVVWEQDCTIPNCPAAGANIKARNLITGQQYDVASGYAPRISGTRVLYESGATLMLRDLTTMAPPVVVANVSSGWSIQDPRIDGDRIAWAETQGTTTWRIMTTRVGQAPTQVGEGTTMGFGGIGLAGDELVYVQGPT